MKAVTSTGGLVSLRPYEEAGDRAYVVRTWVMANAPSHPTGDYHRAIGQYIDGVLPSAHIVIACLTESPAVIVGFVAMDLAKRGIHRLTVRQKWTSTGVFDALVESAIEACRT